MTSELSNFAARLRAFIESGRCAADADFTSLALELFALQFAHNPAYRKICEARRSTPLTVSHWAQVPAVPTSAFKEFELTCLPPAERTHVFHSSGTTEQRPSRHFHNAESVGIYETSLLRAFPFTAAETGRLHFLTPPPSQAPTSSLVHMFDTLRRRSGVPESAFLGHVASDGTWAIDVAAARSILAEADQPVFLFGTAFSFVHLLDFLTTQNLRLALPAGSRVLETGGYKGRSRTLPKAELHGLITRHLGVPRSHIICEYGMSELSSQAYDYATGEGVRDFQFPAWARIQIISPETGREVAPGETGLLRIFDLANVFSVQAIQTEDLGVRHDAKFQLLGRAALAEPRGCSLQTIAAA